MGVVAYALRHILNRDIFADSQPDHKLHFDQTQLFKTCIRCRKSFGDDEVREGLCWACGLMEEKEHEKLKTI